MMPGSKHSDEYRAQQSMRMKEIYKNPELRQRISNIVTQAHRSGTRRRFQAQTTKQAQLANAWRAAPHAVRIQFLRQVVAECEG